MWERIFEHLYVNSYSETDIALARELGLGVELVAYTNYKALENCDEIKPKIADAILGINHIAYHGLNGDVYPSAHDPLITEAAVTRLRQSVEVALYHNAEFIVVHSDWHSDFQRPDEWINDTASFYKDYFEANPSTPRLCIENLRDRDPVILRDLYDKIDDARIDICLDIGHAHFSNMHSLPVWIKTLGGRIGHVHLHDNDRTGDRHWSLGRGSINMSETLELLTEYAPKATYTLECTAGESIEWLRNN